jgi:hypothetical protein
MERQSYRLKDIGAVAEIEPEIISSVQFQSGFEPVDCLIDLICKRNVGCGCKFVRKCDCVDYEPCPTDKCVPYGTTCCNECLSH